MGINCVELHYHAVDFGRRADIPAGRGRSYRNAQPSSAPAEKTKAPQTPVRVMGRSSNSPPPKSARNQPTF